MIEPILPQQPTPARADVASVEWLFEPFWPGDRLVVQIAPGAATVTDGQGRPADAAGRDAGELVRGAVRAERATVDGVWTAQIYRSAEAGLDQRAFVAVDLLELDGTTLLDIPLQERRRLLESIVVERVQVFVTPAVKQPIAGWLQGWREHGFRHFVAKHQNARYAVGDRNDDWLKIELEPARAPGGFVARLIGSRERIRRIRD